MPRVPNAVHWILAIGLGAGGGVVAAIKTAPPPRPARIGAAHLVAAPATSLVERSGVPTGAAVSADGGPAEPVPTPAPTPAPTPIPTPSRTPWPAPPTAGAPRATAAPVRPRATATPVVQQTVSVASPLPASAQEIVDLINQDRAAAGLQPLAVNAALSRAAAEHAGQDAASGTLTHDGVVQDVNAQGVAWNTLAEVIGDWSGSPNAASVNQMWMQSSEHRDAILTPGYTTIGAGWAQGPDGYWYVSAILIS